MDSYPITIEQHDAIFNNHHSGRKLLRERLEKQPNFVLYVKDHPDTKITVTTIAKTTYVSKDAYYESQEAFSTGWISRKRLDEMPEPPVSIKIKIHYSHAKIPMQTFEIKPATYTVDV